MRQILSKLAMVSLFLSSMSFAQVVDLGPPQSWKFQDQSEINTIVLPSVDLEKIRTEDQKQTSKLRTKRLRVGVLHKVDFDLQSTGHWQVLDNGDRIWRLQLKSPDAIHMSAVFDRFYLPKGSSLHLYNKDKTDLLGAYTDKQNNQKGVLGTWFVKGDEITIEYFEPEQVSGQGRLRVGHIMHGYRMANAYQKGYFETNEKALNSSGDCNQDVDCPIGADFEAQRDLLKKGVGFLLMPDPNSSGAFICSGTLVNNTSQDKTPYFLSANHCFGTTDPATYAVRFNWISPNPVCATAANSTDAPVNQTMSGSTLRARYDLGDMMLVEFNNPIPDDWDVTFAGWDRSETTPSFVVGIHHPDGDIMKISRDDSGVFQTTVTIESQTSESWQITGAGGGWEIGVTEGGSSGSALFDQNGRIIGQLFGGSSDCAGLDDDGGADFYGRFATSWNGGGIGSLQLRRWLDPANTNPMTLDALDNVLSNNDERLRASIAIFPNPTSEVLTIEVAEGFNNFDYKLYNLLGQQVQRGEISGRSTRINMKNLTNNVYLLQITEIETQRSFTQKIVLNR